MSRLLDRRLRRALFLLWCLAWLAVVVLSLRPIPDPLRDVSDKLLHVLGYAAMAAAAAGFCHEPRRLLGWAALAVAIGGALELAQAFVPWRSADPLDAAANAAGAALGWLLGSLWLALLIRPLGRGAEPA